MELIDLSIKAGIEASLAIMDVYSKDFGVYQKEDRSPVTDADYESTRIIEKQLGLSNLPVISEESELPSYKERKEYKKYFIVDPLDGTKEFVGKTGEFCVNIALVENDVPSLGLIFDPSKREVLIGGAFNNDLIHITFDSKGEFLSKQQLNIEFTTNLMNQDPLRLICSRRANEDRLLKGADQMFAVDNYEVKKKGSALKFIDLALNRADYYLRFGNTMEWDIAPGYAILKYLKGSIEDLSTKEDMRFNKESLLNPPFLAYNKKLHE